MIRFRLIVLALALLIGQSAFAQIRILPKEVIDSVVNPPLAPNAGNLAFECDRLVADYEAGDNESRTFEYVFENKGKSELIISRLVSTCSCAMANYDKRVIPPGEKGRIRLVYNPEGRIGRNIRRVFVYTDDNRLPSAVLRLEVTHK